SWRSPSVVLVGGRDGDERKAEVTDLAQQAVQCGLVGDRAVEDGGAVGLPGEGHAVEPGGPAVGEVSLHADLVPLRLLSRTHGRRLLRRGPTADPPEAGAVLGGTRRKLGLDVMSGPHHT